jgi:hypothetical protein
VRDKEIGLLFIEEVQMLWEVLGLFEFPFLGPVAETSSVRIFHGDGELIHFTGLVNGWVVDFSSFLFLFLEGLY